MADYWQEAIDAVFYANPEKVKELIEGGHFYPRLLKSTGLLDSTFPIWVIPQFWEAAIRDPQEWIKESRPIVTDFFLRVHQVKDILHEAFGIDFSPVDYSQFLQELEIYDADDTIEDILGDNYMEMYCSHGRRLIDVELYCAWMRFDLPKMKELLLAGANPNEDVPDDVESLYDVLSCDCAYFSIEIWHYMENKQQDPVEDCMLYKLLRKASCEYLYSFIEQYDATPPEKRIQHYRPTKKE